MHFQQNNEINSKTKITGLKIGMLSLVILSFALLPVGRTVEITTVLMAIFGLVLLLNNKTRTEAWSKPARIYTLLFALYWLPMAISLIGAVNFPKTLSHVVEYVRFFFAGIFVLFSLREEKLRTYVTTAVAIVIGFWLIDCSIQRMFGIELFGRSTFDDRITGPFKGLHLPVYLTMLLPLALSYLKVNSSRYIFWPYFVLSLLVFFWAGSRASFIALLLGMIVYGVYVFKHTDQKPYLLLALLLISTGFVAAVTYHYDAAFNSRVNNTLQLFDGNYDSINEAISHRLPIWEAGFHVFIDNPVTGIGARGFRYVYHDYANGNDLFKGWVMSHPHLFALEVLVETGIIGLLAMIYAIAFIIKIGVDSLPFATLDQVSSFITLCIVFFPLNSHVSMYGGSYSQLAWLMTAISLAFLYNGKKKNEL